MNAKERRTNKRALSKILGKILVTLDQTLRPMIRTESLPEYEVIVKELRDELQVAKTSEAGWSLNED